MSIETLLCPADQAGVARAAALLRQGEIIALPTETVYGIAADARNGSAVKKIFAAKGRPQDNPLIVHIDDVGMLPGLVSEFPERARLLAAAFWPGPLTIIMPRGPEVADECCAGLDTVGIRMPSHPVVRQVIEASGCAFAAPSANRSGRPSPTTAQDVWADMQGRLPLILDGGPCAVGVESTVVSVVGAKPTLYAALLALQLPLLAANSAAWAGAVLTAYALNRCLVFHSQKPVGGELASFAALRLVTLLAENALLWLLVIRLSAPAFPAKLLVSVVTVVGNYVLCKFGIFRKETVSHG